MRKAEKGRKLSNKCACQKKKRRISRKFEFIFFLRKSKKVTIKSKGNDIRVSRKATYDIKRFLDIVFFLWVKKNI